MLWNYIVVAWRNIRRQVLYSFINVVGLAVGMAASLVIFLYVYHEWRHDRHFANAERIYRIGYSFFNIGQFARGPELLGEYLPDDKVVETFSRLTKNSQQKLVVDDRSFEELVYVADNNFFSVFQYQFLSGDPTTALKHPGSLVLSETAALKLFNSVDVIGKEVAVGEERVACVVTGVVRDDKRPSHLKANIWRALEFDDTKSYVWPSAACYNYVLLREGADVAELERALDDILRNQIFPAVGAQMGNNTIEEFLANENAPRFYVQPLTDIYLRSKLNLELSTGGNEMNVRIFAVIGIVILLLASVNFINLSTARSARRAKEVGIRKSLGTTRSNLVWQFLLESVMVCVIAMVVALAITELFSFLFFWITGQQLVVNLGASAWGIAGVTVFAVVVGLLSGIYPALYLTAFKPIAVLKGRFSVARSGTLRSALVVFQFSISIALMIATLVIIRQLQFISNHELGFNDEHVLVIENAAPPGVPAEVWKEELLKTPGVTAVSLHTGEPGSKATITMNTFEVPGMENPLTFNTYYGDEHFVDVMGFNLVAGRNFSPDLASDSGAVILNESAARALGLFEDAVGAKVNGSQVVIGVVKDFHWESFRNAIAPTAILPHNAVVARPSFVRMSVKVADGKMREVLGTIEEQWRGWVQEKPLSFHFLDENFGELLKKETVLARAVAFFTALAILISSLGLFGLSAYTTEQRTREIGIRKVMGASVRHIVFMLTSQFTRLVLISAAVAILVTYMAAREWLSGFAYRTGLELWMFAAGALAGLLISAATVSLHAWRASRTDPADTLRTE